MEIKGIRHVFTLILKTDHQAHKTQGTPNEWDTVSSYLSQKNLLQVNLGGTHVLYRRNNEMKLRRYIDVPV